MSIQSHAAFLSEWIDPIFDKYDNDYISPSVKRFLKECIIQLIDVSRKYIESMSLSNGSIKARNWKAVARNGQGVASTHTLEKQLSLLTEWLENFVEPAHISMYTHTVVHIMHQFQLQHSGHGHGHRQNEHPASKGGHHAASWSHQSRPSLSITTPLETGAMAAMMTPIEEHRGFPKRPSWFHRNSTSNHGQRAANHNLAPYPEEVDEVKVDGDHHATNSVQDLRVDVGNGDGAARMELQWTEYEQLSMILVRSLTSMLRRILQRKKVDVVFDGQFDHIIDDVIHFLFSCLTLKYGAKFRNVVGDCLGVISTKYLSKICRQIHARWDHFEGVRKQRTEDVEKFAVLHSAVKHLAFEFEESGRNREGGIDYLTDLVSY